MKKLSVLLFVIVFVLSATAQEKYIEVVVSDTLLVEPQEWILHLSIEKKYDYSTMSDTIAMVPDTFVSRPSMQTGPLELEGTTVAQLSALVKKSGGKILRDSTAVNYNLVINNNYGREVKNDLTASFSSRKSMEKFLNEAAKAGDVQSQIVGTLNPRIEDFQLALEKKLMSNARAKAARLADLGGGKIGSVLVISEVTETEGGWLKNFIETMMKLDFDRKSYTMYMFPDKIKLEKSLKVKFAIL